MDTPDLEKLIEMQGYSLERKIQVTQAKILEWHTMNNGNASIISLHNSASDVLIDLSKRICKNIPVVPLGDCGAVAPLIPFLACQDKKYSDLWMQKGCVNPDTGKSYPLAFWTNEDIQKYIELYSDN